MELKKEKQKILEDNLSKTAFREVLYELLDNDINNLINSMLASSKETYHGEVRKLFMDKGGCKALKEFKQKLNTYVQDQTQ